MGFLSLSFHFWPGPLFSYPGWLDLLGAVPDEYPLTERRGPLGLGLGRRHACMVTPACSSKPDQEVQLCPLLFNQLMGLRSYFDVSKCDFNPLMTDIFPVYPFGHPIERYLTRPPYLHKRAHVTENLCFHIVLRPRPLQRPSYQH